MHIYRDQDADLGILEGAKIAVIGYGNQGRSQAQNLRDSGLDIVVGNREDAYAEQARADGFAVLPIEQAAEDAGVLMLLIPDEIAPTLFEKEIAPQLAQDDVLVFASGYNVAFGFLEPPPSVDVVLVAPRMIGAGVRDLYVAGRGFPSFFAVEQDASGRAKEIALALAKGIGSTRAGVVEVTFAQETELDLFTEQCFGPAFGQVLMTSVNLLLEAGYPPEAVLLELYMSGEFAYTLGKIAELGMIEQTQLHSRTSQYGSMSRGMRFMIPELRTTMEEGLEEIRSGQFAREWAAEQKAGSPTLEMLRAAALSLPLSQIERELRENMEFDPLVMSMGTQPTPQTVGREAPRSAPAAAAATAAATAAEEGFISGGLGGLRRALGRMGRKSEDAQETVSLGGVQMERVLRAFVASAADDVALQAFSQGRQMTTHYVLSDAGLEFTLRFDDGVVTGGLGPPGSEPELRLTTNADVLDGMFTGRINAVRAAMTGKLSFGGDAKRAMSLQQIQDDLSRLYTEARDQVTAAGA